jgi:RNA polymerase sigma-54 factor
MALSQRLEIRQSHALVMTPQLMQAIKLLQLSNLDLAAYVEGELERNPLLEQIGEGEGEADRRTPDRESPSFEQAAAPDWQNGSPDRKDGVTHERLGADLEDVPPADSDAATSRSNGEAPAGYSDWGTTGSGGRDNSDYNLEAFVPVETTLVDHLAGQLALAHDRRFVDDVLAWYAPHLERIHEDAATISVD